MDVDMIDTTDIPRNKPGRPPILDQDMINNMVNAIHNVIYIEHAAPLMGIDPSTFHYWLSIGKKDLEDNKGSIHRQFLEAYRLSKAQVVSKNLSEIANSGKWQANAWILEKCFRSEFSPDSSDVNEFKRMYGEIIDSRK